MDEGDVLHLPPMNWGPKFTPTLTGWVFLIRKIPFILSGKKIRQDIQDGTG